MAPPTILYKYLKPNERALKSLETGQVWYSSPITFNDPFDGFLELPKSREFDDLKAIIGRNLSHSNPFGDFELGVSITETPPGQTSTIVRRYRSTQSESEAELEAKIKSRGLFCMSSDPANILMWSHYAQNHEGVCIGYELNEESYKKYAKLVEVNYSTNGDKPVLDPSDFSDTELAIEKIFTSKYGDWVYEKEWRFIHSSELASSKKGLLVEAPGAVARVIIGLKTDPDYINKLEKIVGKEKLFKSSYAYHKYKLVIEQY